MRIEPWSARREGYLPARAEFISARAEIDEMPDRGRGSSAAEGRRMKLKKRTFIIAAGGTGGHLFPGIAVADELGRLVPSTRVLLPVTPMRTEPRPPPHT